MSILPEQCRAARALLGVEQNDLAAAASVSRGVIIDFEKGRRTPGTNNLAAIRLALEAAGAVFIFDGEQAEGGPGVRLKSGFTPKVKLASDGPHRGAYRRYIDGAPLVDPDEK